ncbi:MAG: acyl-ACP--UDP-N-acetylglucosamine O-acyltransferase [Microscillaceae bacterium]
MQNKEALSFVHPDAKIGDNVTIEPFSVVYENVEIGEGTWIGPNVSIMPGSRIGKHCKIHSSAVIGGIPQDLKFQGEESLAILGDYTVVRECVTVNRGTVEKHETRVGSHCLLMAYVHIAHDCIIEDRVILANAVQLGGHVEIGAHAVVGGASAVHQFVKIGPHTMVAGMSKILKDVPPFVTAAREPLRYDGINSRGLRRRDFSNEQIYLIQEIYRTVFQSGLNNSQAIHKLEQEYEPGPERDLILEFIKASAASGRGIIRGHNK